MDNTRTKAVKRLLDSWQRYYNITLYEDAKLPLKALCEYYESAEGYAISRKANLWKAKSEEFIFLYEMPVLTKGLLEQCLQEARSAGRKLANIGPGHMCTYITPVFVCGSCEAEALRALKKCRIHKTFLFSFHGWLEVRLAVCQTEERSVATNKAGRDMEKNLKKILFS